MMVVEVRGIASIPDELGSIDAAPLLSAGVTTYNALRNAGLRCEDAICRNAAFCLFWRRFRK